MVEGNEEESKEKPDLEQIASEIAGKEEAYSLDQVLPAMYDALISNSKQEKDGKVTYKSEFTEPEKEGIANDIFDKLSYHVHVNIYKFTVKKWEEMKGKTNPDGELYTDLAVQNYFGIDRVGLIKTLKKQTKITPDTIRSISEEMFKHHLSAIHQPSYAKFDEKDVDYMKEWIKKKVESFHLDPALSEKVDNIYTLKEILPLYREIAETHYKKPKEVAE